MSDEETKFNHFSNNVSTAPSTNAGTLLTISRFSSASVLQKSQFVIDQNNNCYTRTLNQGTYTDWRRLLSSSDTYVTSTGSNANGSWRRWSDGYIEQRGTITLTSDTPDVLTFPIAMRNSSWSAAFCSNQSGTSGESPALALYNRTTINATALFHGGGGRDQLVDWNIFG